MHAPDLVVIGASAGAVTALLPLIAGLPGNLPAAVLITVHTAPTHTSRLPQILSKAGNLRASLARGGEALAHGHILIAPPDRHLLVRDGQTELFHGPRENGFRPAIDPLFRSAAQQHGSRTIGVILSGAMGDGALGLLLIKQTGGIALVQDPREAEVADMPATAIRGVEVDAILPAADLGLAITDLVRGKVHARSARVKTPKKVPPGRRDTKKIEEMPGPPSGLTCPECGGALWEQGRASIHFFRCHVGHAFTPEALATAQDGELERALWSAIRALEEIANLNRRRANRNRANGLDALAEMHDRRAADAEQQRQVIKKVVTGGAPVPGAGPAERNGQAESSSSSGRRRPKPKGRQHQAAGKTIRTRKRH